MAVYELADVDAVHLSDVRDDRQSVRSVVHEGPARLRISPAAHLLQFRTGRLQHVALLRGNIGRFIY